MRLQQHKDDTRSTSPSSSQHPWQLNLQNHFKSLQNHCAGLLHNFSKLQSSLSGMHGGDRVSTHTLKSSKRAPFWARIGDESRSQLTPGKTALMSTEDIEERLAGVPVYALSNAEEEFVLVSGVSTGKSLGLFCFKKEDADALLDQMKSMDPGMRNGSQVVPVALNKVFQLKLNGVAFRLIPESSQIRNALEVRQADGLSDEAFPGVPVFQSKSLILKSRNKSYSPVFFRKEDLENSLERASQQQNRFNPALRQWGDIEVGVLEDIIKGMKESSGLKWNDVVFIPPGFDVSADPSPPSAADNKA